MNFVIIASARTGSTHLTDLLNRQRDVVCHGEVFKPRSRSGKYGIRWSKEDKTGIAFTDLMELRETDPQAYLAGIFAKTYGAAAVGFKIFSGQNDTALDSLIADDSVGKIVLLRRNVLAVYSSYLIVRETGKHNFRVLDARPDSAPIVDFHESQFRRFCGHYLEFYRYVFERLAQARQPFHLVNYDEINDPWHFAGLVAFIGAAPPDAEVEARYIKQNSPDILSRFSNPDVVAAFLDGHGLAGWRYEPETSLDPFGDLASGEFGEQAGQIADMED